MIMMKIMKIIWRNENDDNEMRIMKEKWKMKIMKIIMKSENKKIMIMNNKWIIK